jgi:hypothetical protein
MVAMAQPPEGFSRSLNSEPYLPFAGDFQCRKCLCAYAQNAGGETSPESVKMARQAGAIVDIETAQEFEPHLIASRADRGFLFRIRVRTREATSSI